MPVVGEDEQNDHDRSSEGKTVKGQALTRVFQSKNNEK